MDESYVDSVEGAEGAGLINDRSFAITKASITDQNERGGEENIATGYHAIEFLLWGQDKSETGPGNRAYTDFVDGKAANADRRRLYLKTVVTELLVDDLDHAGQGLAAGQQAELPRPLRRRRPATRCARSSSPWVPCRAANWPASVWKWP
jgi:putative iron-regulated protein